MPDGLTVAAAVVLSVSAPLSGWLAFRRDRPPVAWFIFGALSGPLALGVLLLAPPGHCPRCDMTVAGWPAACATCGWRFRGRPAMADVVLAEEADTMDAQPPPLEPTFAPRPTGGRAPARYVGSQRQRTGKIAVEQPSLVRESAGRAGARGLWPRLVGSATERGVPDLQSSAESDGEGWPAGGSAADASVDHGVQMVATGIFTGGSARLEIGSRYAIGRDGHSLVILGPVDRTPNEVQFSVPIETIDLLAMEDRVTVASRADAHDRLAMAFISAAGLRGRALEEALADVTAVAAAPESP